ncbi:MAG: transposase [Bacteroidales bacterium]|nr:transposase [Bacteroidales bacterium]
MKHELCILSKRMKWEAIKKEFSVYFSKIGRSFVPIRRMVGLLLLRHISNLSDESVVARWLENPYWQYFSGNKYFKPKSPSIQHNLYILETALEKKEPKNY